MAEILVTLMGIADLIAGVLIMFAFNFKVLALIFGVLMMLKGASSLSFSN